MRLRVALLAISLAISLPVSLGGCAFGEASQATLQNLCSDDESCALGVCTDGICIDDSGQEVTVVIEVLRGAGDAQRAIPASWAFAPADVSGEATLDLTLPVTRRVVGQVRWQGQRVPATIRFTRRAEAAVAPLSPVPVEVETSSSIASLDGEQDLDYAAVLVDGATYDVRVTPSSSPLTVGDQSVAALRALPPFRTTIVLDDESVEGSPYRLDVLFSEGLDQDCDADQTTGCTLAGLILSFDGETLEQTSGLQIRAIERETERLVSSIGETTPSGAYEIRISEEAGPYLLRVSPSAANTQLPSVSLAPGADSEAGSDSDLILVPRGDIVQVMGAVRDQELRPVQGASVRLTSTGGGVLDVSSLGIEGTFAATAVTDGDGQFSVALLPGRYRVTATPPDTLNNSAAPVATEVSVIPGLEDLGEIVLPSQVGLSGSCDTFDGAPASGATIVARARGDETDLQRSRETVSNANGAFDMSVDAGPYDLLVKVVDSTGYAWWVEPGLELASDQERIGRSYTLDPPIVARGLLRGAGGRVLGNIPMRAYVFEGEGDEQRAIQVAETVTERDGTYRLLISPALGAR